MVVAPLTELFVTKHAVLKGFVPTRMARHMLTSTASLNTLLTHSTITHGARELLGTAAKPDITLSAVLCALRTQGERAFVTTNVAILACGLPTSWTSGVYSTGRALKLVAPDALMDAVGTNILLADVTQEKLVEAIVTKLKAARCAHPHATTAPCATGTARCALIVMARCAILGVAARTSMLQRLAD